MIGIIRRLGCLVMIGMFLVFPGGPLVMGVACRGNGTIDWLDWVLSGVVPGYGVFMAISC